MASMVPVRSATAGMCWWVTFDQQTCSMCHICVHKCPTAALSLRRTGDVEAIVFDAHVCDGCSGRMVCLNRCPERAVRVRRVPAAWLAPEPVVLISGQLARCQTCGARFAPERKLGTLVKNARITAKDVQAHCPACRRTRLLDTLFTERVAREGPGDHLA